MVGARRASADARRRDDGNGLRRLPRRHPLPRLQVPPRRRQLRLLHRPRGCAAGPTRPTPASAAAKPPRPQLVEQCRGVDLAYFDGQYFRDEYAGREPIGVTAAVPRIDWGHGCIEDIIERSRRLGVKQTLIGHHDPERGWTERVELDRWLRSQQSTDTFRIELAKCPMVCEL